MKRFLKNNYQVLTVYIIALVTSLSFILTCNRDAIHLYLNSFVGDQLLNFFFYYINYLGDGRFAPLMLVLMLLYNTRLGICAILSFLTASVVSSILKYGFFDDANRPFFIFSYINKHTLNLVEGVDVHIHNSFPSGHATQAFAILMCAAFAVKNPWLKMLYLFLALGTSLSRVYLSQHWLADITAGSAIGMFFSMLYYYLFITRDRLPRLNKPVLDLRKTP